MNFDFNRPQVQERKEALASVKEDWDKDSGGTGTVTRESLVLKAAVGAVAAVAAATGVAAPPPPVREAKGLHTRPSRLRWRS